MVLLFDSVFNRNEDWQKQQMRYSQETRDQDIRTYASKIRDILRGAATHDPTVFQEIKKAPIIIKMEVDGMKMFQSLSTPTSHIEACRKVIEQFGPCFVKSSREE